MELNETADKPNGATSKEYKVIALRDCPLPESTQMCDRPDKAADYWRMNVATCPYFNPECECFAVLLLNTRRRVKGHQLLTIGTLDTILVHSKEVFRAAVIAAAAAIVLMHNLCAATHNALRQRLHCDPSRLQLHSAGVRHPRHDLARFPPPCIVGLDFFASGESMH